MRITLVIEDIVENNEAKLKWYSVSNPPFNQVDPKQLEASPAFGLFVLVGNTIADAMEQKPELETNANKEDPKKP